MHGNTPRTTVDTSRLLRQRSGGTNEAHVAGDNIMAKLLDWIISLRPLDEAEKKRRLSELSKNVYIQAV
jgi:hypothetical protein